jgi:DHA1 family multidrug resistance protein-like MFS transporter
MATRRRTPLSGMRREVAVLAAVAFAVAVGFGIVAPAIPVFAESFGVSSTAVGSVISAFAFMRFVSALGSGRLVDRLGERVILASGIAIVAVSSALAGVAQSYWQLLVLRGAGGIGSAMFTVSALSLLLRSVPANERGRAAGIFTGGFLLGGIAGPGLAGLLPPMSVRAPFFIYAGTLAVAGSIGMLALPRHVLADRASVKATGVGTSVRDALRLPAYRGALAAYAAESWAAFGVRTAFVPLFVKEALHQPASLTYRALTVGALTHAAGLWPAGRYADRRGRRPVLLLGCVICGVGMGILALEPSVARFYASLAIFGAGSAMLSVAPAAIVGDVVEGRSGTAVAAYGMAGDFGAVVGPLAAGKLSDVSGLAASFLLTSGVFFAALVVAAPAPETRRAESRAPQPEAALGS